MHSSEKYHYHPAMRLIGRAIRREWRMQFTVACVLMAGGGSFTSYFFSRRNILAIFGLVAVMPGLRLGW
ncbi:MAG: hypothetical protein ACE5FF_03100 [Saprospiraceae bacterium]